MQDGTGPAPKEMRMNDPKVDLKQLNQQHQHFFGLTLRLKGFIADGRAGWFDAPELVRMVLAFRHYAFFHFYAEEVYMIGVRYPDYFEHKDLHNQYLESINNHLQRLEQTYHAVNQDALPATRLLDLAEEINAFVVQWWQEHVSGVDAQYIDFSRREAA